MTDEEQKKIMDISQYMCAGAKFAMHRAFIKEDEESTDLPVETANVIARAAGIGAAETVSFLIDQLRVPSLDNEEEEHIPHSLILRYYTEAADALMMHLFTLAAKKNNMPPPAIRLLQVQWHGTMQLFNHMVEELHNYETTNEAEKALEQKKQAGGRIQTH